MLFRCHSCGNLITVNDIENGSGCSKCNSKRMVVAKTTTLEEDEMLSKMFMAGELKLKLAGAL